MNRSKRAQTTAWLVLIFLIVVVIAAILFLSKGYREYLKDYDEFQAYKEYMQALEEGRENDDDFLDNDFVQNDNSSDVIENQPAVSENQGDVSENQVQEPDNTGEVTPQPVGEVLSGSKEITDVSGNVLWQANMVTEEEAALIRSYVEERNEVYTWANSYEKTMKINELDNLILDTAACTFPNVQINFVGDSITEGVGGAVDASGNTISYVNYVQEELQFGYAINNGLAGRMIAAYTTNTELSMEKNHDGLFGSDSEIVVFYMGLNDYLTPEEVKNYGVIDYTTGGYRGQLHQWVKKFSADYPNTEFFFVTTYQVELPNPTQKYINFNGVPTLNDYMEPQRGLAAQYGYPVIELYSTGFMDMHDAQTAESFLADSTHPNDAGYRILGEHIAAEIVLYYLGIS
ncbi:MAG: SGNH/GDSL hydrolase family protein [Lachnospiraceae bacterium]|nr:SGNH/GDSL hydrolase family protein [Lachnospiraceae bacterium]